MTQFLTLVVTGLVSGAIYSLIATCLTLTYQTTGIFNLGYGAIVFTSAFLYYLLHIGLMWPILPAALVTVGVFAPLLGWGLDRLVFRNLSTASDSAKIMATVGILVFLPAAALLTEQIINGLGGHLPDTTLILEAPGIGPSPPTTWHIGKIPINSDQLTVLVVAAVVALGMWLLLRHTRFGLRMRLLVDRPYLAELRGVNRARTSSAAWIIGTMLASLTGVAAAPIFNSLAPATYTLIMFVAIAAAVVGGFRSIPIAFVAGLLLGVLQSLVAGYATFAANITGFNSAVPFLVLLGGVAIWGRSRVRVAGSTQESEVTVDATSDLSPVRRAAPWVVAIVVLCVYTIFIANAFWVNQVAEGLAFGLVFLSFIVITGLGGMVSLAQAAFVALSGLTAGLMINHYHQPYLVALVVGVAAASGLGLLVALPALRLGGLALALATLALGFLADNVLFQWSWLVNGTQSLGWVIKRPDFGFIHLSSTRTLAIVLLILVGLVSWGVRNLQKGASGRAAISMNSSEVAARMSGISPAAVKLFLFGIGAAISGLGGVMLATYSTTAGNDTFLTSVGLVWLASVVLWGIRRPAAAVVAGLSVALFPALIGGGFHFSFLSWKGTNDIYITSVLFGLGAIQMAQDPNGILSGTAAQSRRRRAKRAAKRAAAGESQLPGDRLALSSASNGAVTQSAPGSEVKATAGSDDLFALEGVSAGYGELQVLHDVSISLEPGTMMALVGPNGAGKSTLCRVVSGLMAPTAGHIMYKSAKINGLPAHLRAKKGIILAPEARGIFPTIAVEDNLALHLPKQKDRDGVYDRFPVLGLRRRLPAGSLSGGEQQMLTIGPLLIRPPEVLIADEPTLGLAPLVAAQIVTLFGELRDKGVTLLIVEERAKSILQFADKVAVIELGRIVWTGQPVDLVDKDLIESYFGGATRPTRAQSS